MDSLCEIIAAALAWLGLLTIAGVAIVAVWQYRRHQRYTGPRTYHVKVVTRNGDEMEVCRGTSHSDATRRAEYFESELHDIAEAVVEADE